jgi:hypothetical protein
LSEAAVENHEAFYRALRAVIQQDHTATIKALEDLGSLPSHARLPKSSLLRSRDATKPTILMKSRIINNDTLLHSGAAF